MCMLGAPMGGLEWRPWERCLTARVALYRTYPIETRLRFSVFLARKVAQTVVLGLCICGLGVVERWEDYLSMDFGWRIWRQGVSVDLPRPPSWVP